MQLRVMLVGPMPPTKGGVTTFMLNLMASPLAAEVAFVPFTTSRPPKKDVTENWGYRSMLCGGVRRIVTGVAVTAWHLLSFPAAVVRHRIDLVQVQASDYQVFWESAVYVALAKLLRRPVLMRIGGAFDLFAGGASPLERRLIGRVLRMPEVVIAQSAYAERIIRGAGRVGEITVLPNWIRTMPVAASPAGEGPECLFIAGLEARRKGIEDVLAAVQILAERGLALRLHIIAATPGLAARIAPLRLPGVTTEGPAGHDRVLELMSRFPIFLLPSHGEGFPNSLVEAMAAGMACVATPVGAVPEMAEGGGVMMVPVGDAPALAEAIEALVSDGARRVQLGEAARRTVAARYTASVALSGLAAAYEKLSGRLGVSDAAQTVLSCEASAVR